MAGFRMHMTVSTATGLVYGVAATKAAGFDPQASCLAAGLTAVGGMLPDLDSDSGRPVRELSALAGVIIPLLLIPRMMAAGLTHEGVLAALGVAYLAVRYGMAQVIRRLSVHRGMFHSIPAMLIAGLIVYLEYSSPDRGIRLLLAVGIMLGFLSHLILDEIYAVDFNGVRLRFNQFAGSAVKFFSPSWRATAACYGLLGTLGFTAWVDYKSHPIETWQLPAPVRQALSGGTTPAPAAIGSRVEPATPAKTEPRR